MFVWKIKTQLGWSLENTGCETMTWDGIPFASTEQNLSVDKNTITKKYLTFNFKRNSINRIIMMEKKQKCQAIVWCIVLSTLQGLVTREITWRKWNQQTGKFDFWEIQIKMILDSYNKRDPLNRIVFYNVIRKGVVCV